MHRLTTRLATAVAFVMAGVMLVGCGTAQQSLSPYELAQKKALENVKAGPFDGGRMWTFDFPPMKHFDTTYNFKTDQKWFDDVRMSALRFATYCSASFVSADGLVMTNHHCARESVEEVSKEGEHLLENGFIAPTLEDERKVPNLFVEQLVEIRDVTSEVATAMDAAATDQEKVTARQQAIAGIEQRLGEETKNRVQVVTLYNGGKFSAYIYKRYNDVRLVFAPELQMGYFGGDWDNFTYPRYDLDCSFFRVYGDDGKPLKTEHYYRFSTDGAKEGEPVFVIGNPGRTSRLNTVAQLEFNRDVQYPYIAGLLNDRVAVLQEYAKRHPEKREEMINQIFGISNSQKAYNGQLAGLRNDVLMQRRRDFDRTFRAAVAKRPDLEAKYGKVWGEIAESRAKVREIAPDLLALRFTGMGGLGQSEYLAKATMLAKYAIELGKAEADRAKPFQEKALALTRRSLEKYPTVDKDMEELTLTKQLESMRRMLGADDPIVKIAFGTHADAHDAAMSLLSQTVLRDSSTIVSLVEKGPDAITASQDPFIRMALLAIPRQEAAQKVAEEYRARDQVNNILLGRAMFDVYGTTIPPDATFTLRIADGVVKGYEYNGTKAPAFTTFYGMYDRHYSFPNDDSWALPKRWLDRPADFDLSTPLNFVSTNDIIGGNSGSPMINEKKEVVGLIFDGNIESLPGDFIFAEDANNRTVSVHSKGLLHAVRHIFKDERLARELENGRIMQ